MVLIINVKTQSGGYDIVLERGALDKVGELLKLQRRVLIVTDSGVPEIYAKTIAEQCMKPVICTVETGESSKSLGCSC